MGYEIVWSLDARPEGATKVDGGGRLTISRSLSRQARLRLISDSGKAYALSYTRVAPAQKHLILGCCPTERRNG
jgi:hypothetical protein